MKLSIIMVSYNTKDLLKECINSLILTPTKYSYEIIVIDNNSTDGSKEMLSHYSDIITIFNNENIGFSKANNKGIKKSRGDYILLLNSDTQVLPKTIDKMIGYMDNNQNIGILGPKLISKYGKIIQMSWDFMPGILGEVIRKTLSPKSIRKFKFPMIIVKLLQHKIKEVPVITGASMFINKKVFDMVGLLDEELFLYFEEPDFCKRVRDIGWKIVFYPEAEIIHLLGESANVSGKKTEIYYRKSQLYYYHKHRSLTEQVILKYYLLLKYKVRMLSADNKSRILYKEIIEIVKRWKKR